MNVIDEILIDWSYQVHDGCPNINNHNHINVLRKFVTEQYGSEVATMLIHNLKNPINEAEEDDKFEHLSNSVYVKKGQRDNDDAQRYTKDDNGNYTKITPEEADEMIKGKDDEKSKTPGAYTGD